MPIRLNFIVEGQTEETFVNTVLKPHLEPFSVWANARSVETSRKGGKKHSGGITNYEKAKRDIARWTRQDGNSDVRFTTMFDLYSLPNNFPGYDNATQIPDPYHRVVALETALADDIADRRFIPYLQLHEFETLLLADPSQLDAQFTVSHESIRSLISAVSQYGSPELVDGGANTAPSKRIIAQIPEYEYLKASAGPIVAREIGLPVLRSQCAHFAQWLSKLESLPAEP